MNGFDQFHPALPEEFCNSQDVFLGAACPAVQLKTLAQCTRPRWVVADTVDAWIETARKDLETLLPQIDCLLVNDSEVRQWSGIHNLVRAGKWLLTQGPSKVIIKKAVPYTNPTLPPKRKVLNIVSAVNVKTITIGDRDD